MVVETEIKVSWSFLMNRFRNILIFNIRFFDKPLIRLVSTIQYKYRIHFLLILLYQIENFLCSKLEFIDPMSHSVKIYDTCIGCTQCVRACPTDVLEMIPWDGCKAKQIASAPRTEDCVGCKRCESACPTDFLSVRVYLWHETTRSMGLSY